MDILCGTSCGGCLPIESVFATVSCWICKTLPDCVSEWSAKTLGLYVHVQVLANSPISPLNCLISFLETTHWVNTITKIPSNMGASPVVNDVIYCCPVALMLCLTEPARSPIQMFCLCIEKHQVTLTSNHKHKRSTNRAIFLYMDIFNA